MSYDAVYTPPKMSYICPLARGLSLLSSSFLEYSSYDSLGTVQLAVHAFSFHVQKKSHHGHEPSFLSTLLLSRADGGRLEQVRTYSTRLGLRLAMKTR
jgi:hypothetical protein